jgi:MoaA/NifB/PqqE/SkfB family radical SAM enzyme
MTGHRPSDVSEQPPPLRSAEDDAAALGAARRELDVFPPWPESGRLEVIATTACPFRCRYCAVKLGHRQAEPEVLDRAVDLLLSSHQPRLELQFFGGEPLLRRREVIRTMRRGATLAASQGKQLAFVITTSGLPLNDEILTVLRALGGKVMFSFDGPADVMARYRPLADAGPEPSGALRQKLSQLIQSGVDYFVNLVVTPEGAADVARRVSYVAGLGAAHIQVCYALAPGWTDAAQAQYCESLRQCAALAAAPSEPHFRFQNLGSAAEPTVLSNEVIVDVDGTLYDDAALFAEALLPGLRPVFRLGHVSEIESLDGLRPTRAQNLVALRRAYPEEDGPERRLVEEQLALARRVQHTLNEIARPAARQRDHNPLQNRVLRRPLSHQAKVMKRQPALLSLPMLMLENPCYHDCLFCLPKPLEPTPLDQVSAWLAENRRLGLTRLGLAGNEPLGHPDIDAILSEAQACGFTRFDVLTSGMPLGDSDRARALVDRGVRGYGMPLYAADPAIHDEITQTPGSHAATLQAIETLLSLDAEVHVHANLLRHNLGALAALEQLVTSQWGLPLCVIPIRPKAANRPYLELVPRYSDLVAQAQVSCLVGFPLCVARQIQDPAIPSGTIVSDVLKVYVLDQPFIKPPKCQRCQLFRRCSGTFGPYLDRYGDEELTPLTAPVSPSP